MTYRSERRAERNFWLFWVACIVAGVVWLAIDSWTTDHEECWHGRSIPIFRRLLAHSVREGTTMSTVCDPIYCKGVRPGVIRYWSFEVEGDKWRGHYGIVGGKDTVSGWSTAEAKNVGKANERSAEEQAEFEAINETNKKLAREYRRTVEELPDVPDAVMLAADYKKQKKPLIFNPGAVWSQPKLDGIRLMASPRGGYSREFQPFYSTDHVFEALAPIFARYPRLVLDGELYNHTLKDDFNKIGSLVRKESFTDDERRELQRLIEYHVYDVPSVDEGFARRATVLEEIFAEFDDHLQFTPIVRVPTTRVNSLDEIDALYTDYLEQGYEGQMVRLDAPYEFGVRSKALQKRKEMMTEEFPISRLIEGNGNWAGHAKAVEFVLPGDKRAKDGTRPRAGIKGDQNFTRALLTTTPGPTLVTIRFFGYTPDGMLRFPVAIDWHYGSRRD
jgi:DNA ligase-1